MHWRTNDFASTRIKSLSYWHYVLISASNSHYFLIDIFRLKKKLAIIYNSPDGYDRYFYKICSAKNLYLLWKPTESQSLFRKTTWPIYFEFLPTILQLIVKNCKLFFYNFAVNLLHKKLQTLSIYRFFVLTLFESQISIKLKIT